MADSSVLNRRLSAQRLSGAPFATPAAALAHFGAVQAQDYRAALWALGQRVAGATEATVVQAIADGSIVRTWPLRGTIHFVAPGDARWILGLSAGRVARGMAGRWRQLELTDDDFARSRQALVAALSGGRRLPRPAAYAALEAAGVATTGQRGIHILGRLALDGLICFGPHEGKQPTFVLLDEWAAPGAQLSRPEALAELARRYFIGHGPATLADFVWWSGLTATEARAGLEAAEGDLERDEFEGQAMWFAPAELPTTPPSPVAHLLPVYDEYLVGYRDRSAALPAAVAARSDSGNGIFRPPLLIDGQMAGTWTRQVNKNGVVVALNLFRALDEAERAAVAAAAARYGAFLGLEARLTGEGYA